MALNLRKGSLLIIIIPRKEEDELSLSPRRSVVGQGDLVVEVALSLDGGEDVVGGALPVRLRPRAPLVA